MKNILLFIFAALTVISCQKQTSYQERSNTDLGYDAFKYGEVVATLYAGQNIDVGTVTIGINNDDFIYVTYNTTGDWFIEETHVFVGTEGAEIPVNKPGNPKIGHFPYSTTHECGETQMVTYPTIPFVSGQAFVVATHAVVCNADGQQETAWSYNETATKFSGKRWGWFLNFSYQGEAPDETSYLYFTQYDDVTGELTIYQLNLLTGAVDMISQEAFDAGVGGSIEGAGWDSESNMFLFVSGDGSEIWGTNFDEDNPASFIGNLAAVAIDGTFLGDTYYFVDGDNQIWEVIFDADMNIISQSVIGTLDDGFSILDMAISPDGQNLYFVANNVDSEAEIWVYNLNDETITMLTNLGNSEYQIAFDSGGDLYAVEETEEEGNSTMHDIDTDTGETNNSTDIDYDVGEITEGPEL